MKYSEARKQKDCVIDEKGREVNDPVPAHVIVDAQRTITLDDLVIEMWMHEKLKRDMYQKESFEEQNDFQLDDEPADLAEFGRCYSSRLMFRLQNEKRKKLNDRT